MKKILIFLLISFFVFTSCENKKDDKTITIACNLPISGELSFYGEYIKSGIGMAMEELKDSLDYYNLNFEFDFQDNAGTAKNAVSIFNKQNIKKYDIYMSGVTAQTMAILDLVSKSEKPHFIWSFDPFILKNNDNIYRSWLDMSYEGECFNNYIDKVKPQSIAFIYQNISSTKEQFSKIVGPFVKGKGIDILVDECYDVSKKDFKDVIVRLKQENPDLIIIYGFQNQLSELIKGFNINNIKKEGNILCSFDFLDVQTILDSQYLNGIVTNVPTFIIDNSEHNNKWKADFNTKYGREPLFTDAYAYDFAYTLFYTYKYLIKNPTKSFQDAISTVSFDGVTGEVKYNSTGQQIYDVQPCIYINNEFKKIEN